MLKSAVSKAIRQLGTAKEVLVSGQVGSLNGSQPGSQEVIQSSKLRSGSPTSIRLPGASL